METENKCLFLSVRPSVHSFVSFFNDFNEHFSKRDDDRINRTFFDFEFEIYELETIELERKVRGSVREMHFLSFFSLTYDEYHFTS